MVLIDHVINLLLAGVVVSLATLFGRRLCRWTGWQLPTLPGRVVVSSSLGLAVISLSVFLIGISGLLYLWAILALLAVIALIGAFELPRSHRLVRGWQRTPRPDLMTITLIAVVVVQAVLIVVVNLAPPTSADPQLYHLALPKQYIAEHQIDWMPHFPGASPQLVEMLYTAAMLLRGDVLAALLHVALLFLSAAMVWVLVRQYAGRVVAAWLAAALFLTLPSVFAIGISVKVEAGWVLYSLLAWFALLQWLEVGKHRWLVLLAVCVGLTMNTKYQGIFVVAGLLPAALFGAWARRQVVFSDRANLVPALLIGSGLMIALLVPWYGRNWWYGGDPVWPLGHPLFTSRFYSVEAFENFANWKSGMGTSPLRLFTGPWNITMHAGEFGSRDFRTLVSPVFLALVPGIALAWRHLLASQHRLIAIFLVGGVATYLIWFYSPYEVSSKSV